MVQIRVDLGLSDQCVRSLKMQLNHSSKHVSCLPYVMHSDTGDIIMKVIFALRQ